MKDLSGEAGTCIVLLSGKYYLNLKFANIFDTSLLISWWWWWWCHDGDYDGDDELTWWVAAQVWEDKMTTAAGAQGPEHDDHDEDDDED